MKNRKTKPMEKKKKTKNSIVIRKSIFMWCITIAVLAGILMGYLFWASTYTDFVDECMEGFQGCIDLAEDMSHNNLNLLSVWCEMNETQRDKAYTALEGLHNQVFEDQR